MSLFEIVLHGVQAFLAFITLCCVGSLAHFQHKWHIGISGLSVFLILTTLILLFLPLTMLLPPLLNKRYDTLERITTLLKEPRVRWVLAGTGAGVAAIDAISISASAGM
ncbi:hypothetical protein QFC20_003379 [Naganishia adeliensis]|uniref:Uncharacterized protein n=1 Tax=Naganishia adeliensis TaxID=92952 RepID=A0ACC2WBG7_9TREE|nr:hypothetical protein QFC20_003379 [Naganishia adeliensis]